jgi:hypothetical protein
MERLHGHGAATTRRFGAAIKAFTREIRPGMLQQGWALLAKAVQTM